MKKTLLAVALTAASMTAMADTTLSGQVGYKVGSLEDFNNNDGLTVDTNGNSESRFRILSSTDPINGITYGTNLEFGMGSHGTTGLVAGFKEDGVTPAAKPAKLTTGITKRVQEITASGAFGKVSIGHGSQASDGIGANDFSGTGMIWENAAYDVGGVFADAGLLDGGTRLERIRYDSPSFGPVSFAASLDDGNQGSAGTVGTTDIADDQSSFQVSVKLPAVQVRLGVANRDAKNTDTLALDVAGILGNFTAAAHYVEVENGPSLEDTEQVRVILGYKMGAYNFSVNMQEATQDNFGASGKAIDLTTMGAGLTFAPTKGVELYAGVMQASNDVTQAAGVDDSGTGVILGGKFKF
jgi:predicted porin